MVRWRSWFWALAAALALTIPAIGSRASQPDSDQAAAYDSAVKPILAARCVECHGPEIQKSGLRVDQRSSLLQGGDSGTPSIVPGDSRNSLLVQVVAGDHPDLKMPPTGSPLLAPEVAVLRAWVDQGAEMPDNAGPEGDATASALWSVQPHQPVRPPRIDDPWIANPIDAFILDRLRAEGLSPSPPADPWTLVRRVSLVMHGLPPEPEAVDRFGSRASWSDDDADLGIPDPELRRLIDEVLSSPRYGERWAQHWFDVIRWAETWGFETNTARPDAWPYRDWVIQALNDDKPYDQFMFEQLAGDTVGTDAATGFLVAGPANLPGQIGKDEESIRQARQDELDEIVKTVGETFLGLTIGCARCHSHRFDPVTQRDYYALQAVFSGLRSGHRRFRGPENDRWTAEADQLQSELEQARTRLDATRLDLGLRPAVEPDHHTDQFDPIEARAVRMAIHATNNGGRASLFELEVWTAASGSDGAASDDGAPSVAAAEAINIALTENGGRASASSFALENQSRHPENLNDGKSSDAEGFPWVAKETGPAWVQIELAEPSIIERVVWRRGWDTFPVDYEIQIQRPDGQWSEVAHTRDRVPHEADRRAADEVQIAGVAPEAIADLVTQVAEIRDTHGEYQRLADGPQVFAGTFGNPEPTYRLHRGDPMQRLERVAADVPAVLGTLGLEPDAEEAERRVALARQLTNPANPLTARVMVNRIWQHHFGTGLVETPSDFGNMGAMPSHPELLDWLAVEFIQNGWSIKHIQRLILSSSTFRQASTPQAEPLAVDADSRLLWRFPPRRLEAEAIRDSILRVSGKLELQMFGPGFDFFNQKGGLSDYVPKETFDRSGWRRMIYATKIRMQSVDVFGAFDCPDAGQMTPRRTQSITPIQALNLWNSTFVHRQAGFFADRVRAEAGPGVNDQVAIAARLALGRPPTEAEIEHLADLCARSGLEQVCRVLFNTNEFVFLK